MSMWRVSASAMAAALLTTMSIPPNLLAVANTESTSRYQEYCRDNNIPIHPARFPAQLPEYFLRMLTDPGDLVVDPFAGSCVTGAVAEALRRKWVGCELSEEYLQGAVSRFTSNVMPLLKEKVVSYDIATPCSLLLDEDDLPLFADGGAKRPVEFRKAQPIIVEDDEPMPEAVAL
jgi:site-specific DNA-methyltransferase (cytosine-N4-specific)